MDPNVGRVRREGAVPPQVVRRAPRERRQGERHDFDQELERRSGRPRATADEPAPSSPPEREPHRDSGDGHVDVTA